MEQWNYFNYFTEIEEYFWRKRGSHLLVSPLDWAILETWQKAGIPLDTVLRGIDTAFESYTRSRRAARGPLKSLAYCVDAVLEAAAHQQDTATGKGPAAAAVPGPSETFSRAELRQFFDSNAARLSRAAERLASSDADLSRRIMSAHASIADLFPLL